MCVCKRGEIIGDRGSRHGARGDRVGVGGLPFFAQLPQRFGGVAGENF